MGCGAPDTVPNSNQIGPSTFLFGDSLSYTCHLGYEHTGTATTRTCQANGTWSTDIIECSGLSCCCNVKVQSFVVTENIQNLPEESKIKDNFMVLYFVKPLSSYHSSDMNDCAASPCLSRGTLR